MATKIVLSSDQAQLLLAGKKRHSVEVKICEHNSIRIYLEENGRTSVYARSQGLSQRIASWLSGITAESLLPEETLGEALRRNFLKRVEK